ncbi:serine hydrolase FSH [Multifurca ochricompacta]|uniref:Serine hydrolase FSH n=1 Tax=Multifurca ochricompacta TaxID=376703 RepID=A0AAD4M3T9_9AGAM|nr:serine hydrolase FSH [Multifurca ochricompacta]
MSDSGSFAPKVLMLHGYSQNASIFSKRLAALRKSLGNDLEFVFVDAPHVLLPVDLTGHGTTSLDTFGAVEASATSEDPTLKPRGWWRTDPTRTRTDGLEESLAHLRDILNGQRFEGVFGFSQGAAMAAMLAALLERPHLHSTFLVDGEPLHPPFKFCVAVSGFKMAGPLSAAVFSEGYATPTLHVLGKNDILVIEERSRALIDVSAGKRVEVHDGGHFVPSKASWRAFLKAYMLNPMAGIPGPGQSSVSQPGSGAVTPLTG